MKSFILLAILSGAALANSNDLSHRPKSFSASGGKAVFVDFTEATYKITYDLTQKKASVRAEISFDAPEAGRPIFDSVQAPTSITLDGSSVTATETKTPSNETTLRVINRMISSGSHKMAIEVPLTELVKFDDTGVKSAFWTSDLDERQFAELYMPANFEFDQVKMTYIVNFIGAKAKQIIYTNGTQSAQRDGVHISYPAHYTSSSVFFHTVPEGAVDEMRFSLTSIDGRTIPAVVYLSKSSWGTPSGSGLQRLKDKTTTVFHELESDYGAFLHPQIIVYNAGSGGMEYCGATMTDYSALGHELFHSYFARGVMPANGNAGWLDEALASWRDGGYRSETDMSGTSRMSAHPYYTRTTDDAAYTFGARFMAYIDGTMTNKGKGGLKPFLREMVAKRSLKPLFVEEFTQSMSSFYEIPMDPDFKKYTYDPNAKDIRMSTNPIHRKMSLKELKDYL
jgi:hypothetical protein